MVPCGNRSLGGAVSARHRFSVKLNQAIGYGTIKPGLEIRTRCVRLWLRSFIVIVSATAKEHLRQQDLFVFSAGSNNIRTIYGYFPDPALRGRAISAAGLGH